MLEELCIWCWLSVMCQARIGKKGNRTSSWIVARLGGHTEKFGTLSLATTVILVWNLTTRLAFLKDFSGCVRKIYWRERKWRLEGKLEGS